MRTAPPIRGRADQPVTAVLRRLPYFLAVAEELHFGRAARRLNVAQPPLSQQIRRLEADVGFRLFERRHSGPQRVTLTPAGEALLETARRALALTADGVDAAQRVDRGESGTLTLGFAATVMLTPVADIVRAYRERYPGVELRLREMVTATQVQALHTGELDAGFLREPAPDDDLATEPVVREPYAMAIPAHLPAAIQPDLTLAALAAEPFVLFPRSAGPTFYDQIVGLCKDAGFTPRIVQEAVEWQTVIGLVAAGLGVSLVPAGVRALRAPGVVYRPLPRGTPGSTIVLAWRTDDRPPPVAGLIALLKQYRAEQLARH